MTILLIEDEGLRVESMKSRLHSLGYDVTVCGDAESALEVYHQSFYPLIAMDVGLPEMDIAAFCRRIRALPQGARSLILALTGSEPPEDFHAAIDAGVDDYLITPVSPKGLHARLTILERRIENLSRQKQAEKLLSHTLQELQRADEELRVQNEELSASNEQLIETQTQLKASRQTYVDLYDFAPVGYCAFDEDGIIQEANLTLARLLGLEKAHLINMRFYHFIVEEDRGNFFLYLRTLFTQRTRHICELRLIGRDGSKFSAQLDSLVSQEDDPRARRCRSAISDITDRIRLEEELQTYRQHLEQLVETRTAELKVSDNHLQQEITGRKRADRAVRTSEEQFRLLAENVADGIGILQDGKLVFVNGALKSMTGFPEHQLLELDFIDLLREEHQEAAGKRFDRRDQDLSTQDWHSARVAGEGREIWIEFRQRPIEWEGIPAILLTVRDISTRKLRESAIEKERAQLRKENIQLRSAIDDRASFGELVGKSPVMQAVYAQIVTAAAVDANVLISGESGTGKELAARTIHQISQRKTKELVAVNCGAISENLFEREFFGHRKGAFTGADKDKPGFFDRAHKGTLFLDEVGELPLAMQVKLLRVIETGEYTAVGDNRSRQVDVRLIAATNKNLETLVQQGAMREDFFYRIYVLTITMPRLRDHREDIPLLIEHFLQQHSEGESSPTIPERIIETLAQQAWPGNVRELYNVLQRYLQDERLEFTEIHSAESDSKDSMSTPEFDLKGKSLREAVESYEKCLIVRAFAQNHDNMAKTAASLQMPLRTLYRKIEKYQLL